jgi:uncharacterized protein YchJ
VGSWLDGKWHWIAKRIRAVDQLNNFTWLGLTLNARLADDENQSAVRNRAAYKEHQHAIRAVDQLNNFTWLGLTLNARLADDDGNL